MFRNPLLNVLVAAGLFLLPCTLAIERLAHPAPWIAFLIANVMLLTQPPLGPRQVVADVGDRMTGLGIYIAQIGSGLVAVFEFVLRPTLAPPPFSAWIGIGVGVAVIGLGLRVWAIRTLGRFFTSVVRVTEDQVVVQSGPYRLLRHPSYTGALLAPIAVCLVFASLWGLGVVLVAGIPAYLYRMGVEEAALTNGLGESYREYRGRTWRLIPFIY